jgi:hypothetical protein
MPSPCPQSAFKHVLKYGLKKMKFNTLAVDIVVYQHISSIQKSQSLQLVNSFPFLFLDVSLAKAADRLCYTSVLTLVVCRHQGFSARDVEQREIHTPLRLQPILCPLFQCRLDTLAAVAADPGPMSAQGLGAIGQTALRGRSLVSYELDETVLL